MPGGELRLLPWRLPLLYRWPLSARTCLLLLLARDDRGLDSTVAYGGGRSRQAGRERGGDAVAEKLQRVLCWL